ncbi:MAG TPA: DegT/DnrJ/EryC1/StrS family aminotransferase [Candidatus Binatia bacterium]|nr:DegT/DnrJ/EryC1/StrS family aminotransferase [Candidatus Binatia bacterium]
MNLTSHFYRVPLAVPYWNRGTYRRILQSFCSGSVIDGADLHNLRSLVIEGLGVKEAALCGSGSLALEIALRACDVRRGDEVVIPTFCCSAVVPPILALGATPVLADAGEELNLTVETVGAVLTQKTKAIIVPHLFGNPADISAIIELVCGKNVRVIDDAAQALGATLDGRPVGSFGDAGILSFGSEKVCFGLGGGAVISSQKNLPTKHSMTGLAPPRLFSTLTNFLSTLVWRRWRRWTLPVQAAFSDRKSRDPDELPSPYRKERMANLNSAVALSLLQNLRANVTARRARVHAFRELLGSVEGLQLVPHRTGSACLTQVARVLPHRNRRDSAARVIKALGRAGYEIQGSYVPIHLLSNFDKCVWDYLSYAERIWADLIELPCEPNVSFDYLERIAAIVKQTVNS